jgi:hypothetical protein
MNMKNHEDVLADGSDWELSLVKLAGKSIKDITGYISEEFGTPTFKMHTVVFEDGLEMGCEGEHDMPYLVNYKDAIITKEQFQQVLETDPSRKDD